MRITDCELRKEGAGQGTQVLHPAGEESVAVEGHAGAGWQGARVGDGVGVGVGRERWGVGWGENPEKRIERENEIDCANLDAIVAASLLNDADLIVVTNDVAIARESQV